MKAVRALLVTDLVDSTAIAHRIGDLAMTALWVEHDRLARDLLQTWNGREIDRSDGFFLLFDQASDALGYAIAWHAALQRLGARHLSDATPTLQSRIGLHVGEVFMRANPPDDVARGAKPLEADGLAKAVAARVMSLARGGQTLLSAPAVDALRAATLPPGLEVRSHGHWRLKGLVEPMELFEAGPAGTAFVPPGDSDKVHRVIRSGPGWLPAREVAHHLPAEADGFVGRADALRRLGDLFDAGARLICVHGMGGAGKTRLALHYGWRWLGDFAAGAWFCDLAGARDLDGVLRAMATGLQVPLGRGNAIEQIGHAIAGRGECLVIVDNCEQVSGLAPTTLWPWIRRAPKARFLVTSRELLHLPGEHVLPLPPLTAGEGAELFRLRAEAALGAAADADKPAVAGDRAALESLVELLDGLPLAIELAAARSALLPPRELLRRMGERFELLGRGRGAQARHMTLRATLDWSWDLLDEAERAALARLSVFEGGATLAAAEAVITGEGADGEGPVAIDLLQSLLDKSLLRSGPRSRLQLLAMVREYAAECLATPGRCRASGPQAVAEARRRHARHFAGMSLDEAVQDECVELDNLVAATRHAVAAGDGGLAAAVLDAAWAALRLRGPFALGLELADQVLALAGADELATARAQRAAAGALHASGRLPEARARAGLALDAASRTDDRVLMAELQALVGDLEAMAGRITAGHEALAQALAGARSVGDRRLESRVRTGLGAADALAGDLDGAIGHYEQALVLARACGDRRREGGVLGNLGTVRHQQGRWQEARSLYREALGVARAIGDRQWAGNALSNLGLVLQQQGELEEAGEALRAALQAARELGHRRLECIALSNLGQLAEAQHDDALARERFEQALLTARELADQLTAGQISGYLGALHARAGRHAQARSCFDDGEQLLAGVAGRMSLGLLLCERAWCEHQAGQREAARQRLQAAQAIAAQAEAGPTSELRLRLERLQAQLAAP